MQLTASLRAAAKKIRCVVFDVDGVLTDGKIYYGSDGTEFKSFHVGDGAAIKLLQRSGITVAIITGRNSPMVTRRAAELGVEHVYQGNDNKAEPFAILLEQTGFAASEITCVGDDLADLVLFDICGLALSVPNAHVATAAKADYITQTAPGNGVAREVAELLLRSQGQWPF